MTLPILFLSALAAAPPFTAAEMMRLQRIADPQLSPDGRSIAYQATRVDTTAWTRNTDIWVIPAAGGTPRRVTDDAKSDSRPRWSRDGRPRGASPGPFVPFDRNRTVQPGWPLVRHDGLRARHPPD